MRSGREGGRVPAGREVPSLDDGIGGGVRKWNVDGELTRRAKPRVRAGSELWYGATSCGSLELQLNEMSAMI